MRQSSLTTLALLVGSGVAVSCGGSGTKPNLLTEPPTYTSEVPSSASGNQGGTWNGGLEGSDTGLAAPTTAAGPGGDKVATTAPVVPGGRVADVQEADVYRIQNNKLFLLNTYRGFLVYDITDTTKPARLSRLPVYGYPVEMFVENNTVYALLSDALYLTQRNGTLQFERRNTSQLVTIDVSDPANPKLLQALDIAGQLREGVSRKIESTVYVVSYQPSGYWYYGWGPQNGQQPDEAAWVYSYDVSTPTSIKQMGKLQVFQGGSTSTYDPSTGENHSRYSNGIALSATSNAIMVVQNWYTSDYVPAKTSAGEYACGYSKYDQDSVVSIVDVSNPAGLIRVAATFATAGQLGDQFKQTYVFDKAANTGTYLGIFARNVWSGDACQFNQQTQNTILAYDIVGDGTARKLSALDFGKPNETVRGSYFDADRKVAFAITAQAMDPMYAISFADRNNLEVLSLIDGLSGDMDLFRPLEGGQYLLAVGRDTGAACASYVGVDPRTKSNGQIGVSLIDVRDLGAIRLVQRKCLDVANAGWVSSSVTWDLDQAHKKIGMHSDGKTNALTVPISYSVEDKSRGEWYWYRYETAVGIVSWDLARYDASLPPEQQNVIATHGRFVHPSGEVSRSVLFAHGSDGHREMLNISDTHLSFANLQNLDSPALDAVVELAPASAAVYRFGDHIVEQVALPSSDYSHTAYELRVRPVGADFDKTAPLTTFTVGQVQQVLRQGNLLVFFRAIAKQLPSSNGGTYPGYVSQVLVYDLSVPTAPKPAGTVMLPDGVSPYGSYYRYYCGGAMYYPGYYYGYLQSTAQLAEGIAFLIQSSTYTPKTVPDDDGMSRTEYEWTYSYKLAFLDLRDPVSPQVSETDLSLPGAGSGPVDSASLVADGVSPSAFYLSYRIRTGSTKDPQTNDTIYKYASFAQRWLRMGGAWQTEGAVNIPGNLTRTWAGSQGERLFLTRDDVYSSKQVDSYWQWFDTVSLNLLRQVEVGGTLAAERLDLRTFADSSPKSMVFDGDRIHIVSGNSYYYYYGTRGGAEGVASGTGEATDTTPVDTSDHLAVIDMSQGKLALVYDLPTELSGLELMGVYQDKLFVNLQGDGILVVDVANAAAPKVHSFHRVLGWPSGIEFAGANAYLPAYNYGTLRIDLTAAGNI